MGGMIVDSTISAAITATEVSGGELPIPASLNGVKDVAQAVGAVQTAALANATAFGVGGLSASVTSVGLISAVPAGLAGIAGFEAGHAFNNMFEGLTGKPLGVAIYDLFNSDCL